MMVAFDQGSRAVVKRPSLRDSGTIPVQYHAALRDSGGIFANPSGREGGTANQKQDNTRPKLTLHNTSVVPSTSTDRLGSLKSDPLTD